MRLKARPDNRKRSLTTIERGVLAEVTERSVVVPQTAEREEEDERDSHRTTDYRVTAVDCHD
jgi:hypothetical protein